MPAESDRGPNGIERSGQLLRVQIPVIFLVVQAHHLLQERNVADLVGYSFEDHHFVPPLQMDCDGGLRCQVLCSKRTRAEIEGIVEPNTPDRAAVRLTSRTGRRDPIGACPAQSLRCPPPRQARRPDIAAKHPGLAGLWVNAPINLPPWFHRKSA